MKKAAIAGIIMCVLSALALGAFSSSFAETPKEAKVFKIGLITSVTGQMAPAFKPMYDAVKPTEELINRKVGLTVGGQKYTVEIVAQDDQSSPAGAVTAVNKLMQDGIRFLIPPMFYVTHLAIIQIAEEGKILRMKAFGLSPNEVNPKTPYGFGTGSNLYNVEPCFDYLVKNYPQAKRVAIIMPDDPGMNTALDLNEKAIKKRGLQMVFLERFKMGSEDFYPILTHALAQKPDVINMPVSMVTWSAGIINQSRELGFKGPIFAPGLFGDINIVNGMLDKKYANDLFHGGPDVLSDKMSPLMKELRKAVEQAGQPFIMDSMLSLDASYPLLQAVEKAQSFDTDKVAAAIESTKTVDSIWGKSRWGGKDLFGVNHCLIKPVTISRIVNGKVEQLDFIQQ